MARQWTRVPLFILSTAIILQPSVDKSAMQLGAREYKTWKSHLEGIMPRRQTYLLCVCLQS